MTVSVRGAYGWPFQLVRTKIRLDGAEIPENAPVPVVGVGHRLEYGADLSVPCGLFSPPQVSTRVQTTVLPFLIDTASAIEIDVRDDRGQTKRLAARLHVGWTLRGAQIAEGAEPLANQCLGLDRMHMAECGVAARIGTARVRGEHGQAACLMDRLAQIRTWLPQAANGDSGAGAKILELERATAIECTPEVSTVGQTIITGATLSETGAGGAVLVQNGGSCNGAAPVIQPPPR